MIDVANLSLEERVQLLDKLWESLSRTPAAIPVTNAQREELDRRLDELDRDGPVGIPEVLRRIWGPHPATKLLVRAAANDVHPLRGWPRAPRYMGLRINQLGQA
jgi:putative addiction module component (TIGR02574 family)